MSHASQTLAQQTLNLIDLTELSDIRTHIKAEEDALIRDLCERAVTQFGNVATVCVYSRFIELAKSILGRKIKIASVINFPFGISDIETVKFETKLALSRGASEIELVFPYKCFKLHESTDCCDIIKQVKTACGDKKLKVIIETEELGSTKMIRAATELCIEYGANFIQTSTGKRSSGATLEATEVILHTIKTKQANCGLKVSGGIEMVAQAERYIQLATDIMGEEWINPNHLRFGSLNLLDDVLNILAPEDTSANLNFSFGLS